jgi:hypothetical protein
MDNTSDTKGRKEKTHQPGPNNLIKVLAVVIPKHARQRRPRSQARLVPDVFARVVHPQELGIALAGAELGRVEGRRPAVRGEGDAPVDQGAGRGAREDDLVAEVVGVGGEDGGGGRGGRERQRAAAEAAPVGEPGFKGWVEVVVEKAETGFVLAAGYQGWS